MDAIDTSDRFINGLESVVEITLPDGGVDHVELAQTAAGRYEGRYELAGYGAYLLSAQHAIAGDTVANSFGSLTYPYSDEYLTFEPTWDLGRRVASLTDGSVDPTPTELWDPLGEEIEYRKELWPYALFAALFLFVSDLLFRRVRVLSRKPIRWGSIVARR